MSVEFAMFFVLRYFDGNKNDSNFLSIALVLSASSSMDRI